MLAAASILFTVCAAAIAKEIRVPVPAITPSARPAAVVQPSRLTPAAAPVSRQRSGARSESEAAVFELPFFDDFANGDATKANYTVIDVDNDGITYGESSVTNRWFWKADESLVQYCVDQENPVPGNDWFMTPGIHLDGKTTYKVTIVVNMGRASNLRVTVGNSLDPADHTTEILDLNNITCSGWFDIYTGEFTVPGDGTYYLGLYNYSTAESFYFNLFQIEVVAGESTAVPAAPADFTVTPAEGGVESAVMSFTAPDRLLDGTVIEQDVEMIVRRDGDEIYRLTVAPGQTVELTDDSVVSGRHTYRVCGALDGVEGRVSEVTVWVGQDMPAAPSVTRFTTVNGNMDVVLEWTEVTEGQNGYFFDPSKVTYTVYRGYDSRAMAPVATGLTGLSYTDTEISSELNGRQDAYFYGVAAVSPAGETLSSANIIAVGTPYSLPCKESFTDGGLDIEPWLTDPISGSFGWSVITLYDGMQGHDNDNGLIRFYDPYGGWDTTDSRLISPVMTLAGNEHPVFGFWMYHWQDASVAYESSTRMFPEIRVNGGEWMPLCDPILAATPDWGWIEHRFELDAYKEAETVQFALRGLTDVNWMYFFLDQITVEDSPEHDLQVTDFYGAESGDIEQSLLYRIDYYNHGSQPASDYTVQLVVDGEVVWSTYGDELAPGESGSAIASYRFNAASTGQHMLTARVVYDLDSNQADNESHEVMVTVNPSFYPTVGELNGTVEANGSAHLTWSAPTLPAADATVIDGAEDYEPWLIDGIGGWLTVDRDQLGSGYYLELPHKWPNCESNQAFIVWAPDEEMLEVFPSLKPYSGDQCFVSWLAVISDFWSDPVNDDWLISPEVRGGTQVSFMVKGIAAFEENETYEVLWSAGGRSTDDFELLHSGVAGTEWEQITVTLPAEARYFAIRYTATYQSGLMVDDIEYTPVTGSLEIQGYEVFRNGVKLTDEPVAATEYVDGGVQTGSNFYSVAVVYDRGRSNACDPLNVVSTGITDTTSTSGLNVIAEGGSLIISVAEPAAVTVCGADGVVHYRGELDGGISLHLQRGVYIVTSGDETVKVVL